MQELLGSGLGVPLSSNGLVNILLKSLSRDSPFSTKRASGTGVLADGTGLPLNHLWELTGRIQAVLGILQAVQKYRLYRSGKRADC